MTYPGLGASSRASSLAVAAGAFGAVLLVAFLKGSILGVVFGAMLSPLPLAMAALGLGSLYLPVAVVSGAVTVTVLTGSFFLAAIYLLVDAAPVALLTRFAHGPAGAAPEGGAMGRAVAVMITGAVVLVVAGLLAMAPEAAALGGIEASLRSHLSDLVAATPLPGPAEVDGVDLATARTEMVRKVAGLLPGAAALNWSLRALVSAALGQLMLKRAGLGLWTTPAYRRFAVPGWFFLLLGGIVGVALLLKGDPGLIAGNAAIALCLPPMLQGLAVVHCALGRLTRPRVALAVFYVTALRFPAVFLVGLVAAGVMDHFFQLRDRFPAPRTGGE